MRKRRAIIAAFKSNLHIVAFDCFVPMYAVTECSPKKIGFQRGTKDKADELSIHGSVVEEKLFSIR